MSPQPMEGYLPIGQVLRPQGLKGLVKVRPDTDDPGRFLTFEQVFVKSSSGALQPQSVSNLSVRSGFVYLSIEDDSMVEEAETRRNLILYIPREQAAPLSEFENYITDLIGCQLTDTDGKPVGLLEDVLQPGANDVYVVRTQSGSLLVPALRDVVLSVDVANKQIIVDAQRMGEVSVAQD